MGEVERALVGLLRAHVGQPDPLEHPGARGPLLARTRDAVGDALERPRLLEGRGLRPAPERHDEDALGLALGGHERGEHRAAAAHPAGERPELRPADLELVEQLRAQGGLRFRGGVEEERLGELGLDVVQVSRRVHGRDASGMERPELGRG
jgi:hypothetical protein